jgi:hypothetical protein
MMPEPPSTEPTTPGPVTNNELSRPDWAPVLLFVALVALFLVILIA